jgi:hypothetical protein
MVYCRKHGCYFDFYPIVLSCLLPRFGVLVCFRHKWKGGKISPQFGTLDSGLNGGGTFPNFLSNGGTLCLKKTDDDGQCLNNSR